MNNPNKIAVINQGRSGTSYTAAAIKMLLPTHECLGGLDYFLPPMFGMKVRPIKPLSLDTPWVLHHNWWTVLEHLPKDTIVVRPYRRDLLAVAFSSILAKHTGEYATYTDKQFDPIFIDPDKLGIWLNDCINHQRDYIREAESLNFDLVNICFEDLLAEQHPENFLADLLGIEKSENFYLDNLDRIKNPRKASDSIINYQQLCEQFIAYTSSGF